MDFKKAPWAHQLRDIRRIIEQPQLSGFGLFYEMGTGKTGAAINILRVKIQLADRLLRTFIFCPPIVIGNWQAEFEIHSSIPRHEVIPLYGSGAQRLKRFMEATVDPRQGRIFITNYESLLMDELFKQMLAWRPEAVVFDESHKLKSPTSQRSKLAHKLANPAKQDKPFTLLLSGTPVLNSPMDIFQQYKVMDGGKLFTDNFWIFQARYFRDRNAGMKGSTKYFPDWQIRTAQKDGFDAMSELTEKMFSCASRVEKKDCLDLPPEVSVIQKVGMSAVQARLYKEMKNDFITYMDSKACTASLAITKALRLMQITSGFVSLENEFAEDCSVEKALGETPKIEALREMLEELCVVQKRKVLVWAVWAYNYGQIKFVCEKLGIRYVEVHGRISAKGKRDAVDQFLTDKDIGVFLGHPGSGGIGINLVNAPYSIFYSRTFSLEHYLQARARNYRAGAKEQGHESITHYDLVCEGTIDELVVRRLAEKIELGGEMLRNVFNEI